MEEMYKFIPLRCQACPRFISDINKIHKLATEELSLEAEERVLKEDDDHTEHNSRYAQLEVDLASVAMNLARHEAYTVGCPGPDMHDMVHSGQPVYLIRCRSPLGEL